jgi:uncharacterized protein YbjT (DUF2867 family)
MPVPLILSVGADGDFAGLVVPELVRRGARVRGLIHKPDSEAKARANGATEVVVGDLRDPKSLDRALKGVDGVFYIAPVFQKDEAQLGENMVAATIASGVRRFVFSSVIHPVLSALTNHAAKAPVEEAVLNSSLEYTFLHPTLFFQNYAGSWSRIVQSGVLAEPWSTETSFSRVDYRDVAEVAAIALVEDRLLHGTFELCSEGELNRHDVAALISEIVGRPIRAERINPDALGDASTPMRLMFEHYDKVGLVGNPLTLRAILGREPRTLRAYFAELAVTDKAQDQNG